MNKNYELRDRIIFGKYDPESYRLGGCKNFHCSYATMKKLFDEEFIDPDDCQNYSPSAKDFMEYLDGVDNVEFIAYAISPTRDDYRITIEGADVEIEDTDYDTITRLVGLFGGADEFTLDHSGSTYYLHAWWD